jgi:T-complex protein 1 subunit eta
MHAHTTPVCCLQVAEEDLQRVAEASGGQIQTTVNKLSPKALGTCAFFEERQVGAERYNLFKGAWAGEGGRCCGSERGSSV